jgi:dihydroorotate dehydrogenase
VNGLLYEIAKKILFRFPPEQAHTLTFGGLEWARRIPGGLALLRGIYGVEQAEERRQELFGLGFDNPVGLAAGLDKNGTAVPALSALGFGFLEVGTVTPKPQPGNDKPRLFRLVEEEAIINRMGFNNAGADAMADALKRAARHRSIPVAVNIGKNKTTPNERAADDYCACVRRLYPWADFFVVNISSPNTPDLRALQHGDDLKHLLHAVKAEVRAQAAAAGTPEKPVLVKIAPDLTREELERIVDTTIASGVAGMIATNTTVSREGISHRYARESGGLSGRPLTARSTEVIRSIFVQTRGKLPIIGCGGIFTAADAYDKIRAGASLVEVYTGFIYRGPGMLREINRQLSALLKRDGFSNISEAVGTGSM